MGSCTSSLNDRRPRCNARCNTRTLRDITEPEN